MVKNEFCIVFSLDETVVDFDDDQIAKNRFIFFLFLFYRYIYIVDSGNNRIIRWTDNYAAGGTCIVGCTGSSGVAATQLKGPRDLKFDASGNLYVSDQGNNRVQKFMIQISPNCSATSSKYSL